MKYSIIITLQILTAWAVCKENNCTIVPCLTDIAKLNRRQWPQFDFEFYHDSSNTLAKSTELPPELPDLDPPKPTSSEMKNTSKLDENFVHDHVSNRSQASIDNESNNKNQTHCQTISAHHETIKRLDWIRQSFLLRSVFREQAQQTSTKRKRTNISEHFRRKLLQIYRLAIHKQNKAIRNGNQDGNVEEVDSDTNHVQHLKPHKRNAPPDLNVTIWDIQISKSKPEIDVVYLLSRTNVPVPYEDAAKLLSFVDRDMIQNSTGYSVVHKVLKYDRSQSEALSVVSSSIVWKWLLILCVVLLTMLFLIAVWMCYTKHNNRDPIGTLHHEISRLSRSRSDRDSRRSSRLKDTSHQNLGLETSDSESEAAPPIPRLPPPPSLHRIDASSQASLDAIYSKPSLLTPISRNFSSLSNRTGAYPVNPNPDYDRISYIKTKETIEEKRKQQNIVEVQMSKETQSIVKEIRNELNRYNMKKILDDAPVGTSEA